MISEFEQIKPITIEDKSKTLVPIVFNLNDNYCKYLSVVLISLIENRNPNCFYDIVVLTTDVTQTNENLIINLLPENISVRFYDVTNFLNSNECPITGLTKTGLPVCASFRLFIPILMSEYERVIYLDTDMCIVGDISDLMTIDLEGMGLGAVVDGVSLILEFDRHKKIRKHIKNSLMLENPAKYFNSGFLVFQMKNLNRNEYIKRVRTVVNKKLDLVFVDQDILNLVFENNYCSLPSVYNYQVSMLDERCTRELDIVGNIFKNVNPLIVHYTATKPWNGESPKSLDIWGKYAKKSPFYTEIVNTSPIQILKRKYRKAKLHKCFAWGAKKTYYKEKCEQLEKNIQALQKLFEL